MVHCSTCIITSDMTLIWNTHRFLRLRKKPLRFWLIHLPLRKQRKRRGCRLKTFKRGGGSRTFSTLSGTLVPSDYMRQSANFKPPGRTLFASS